MVRPAAIIQVSFGIGTKDSRKCREAGEGRKDVKSNSSHRGPWLALTLGRAQHAPTSRRQPFGPRCLLSCSAPELSPTSLVPVSNQGAFKKLATNGMGITLEGGCVSQANPSFTCKALPYTSVLAQPLLSWLVCPGYRPPEQVGRVFQVEFLPDSVAIRFDGFDANMKLLSDLPRVKPASSQLEDLQFAVCQRFHGPEHFSRSSGCDAAENLRCARLAEEDLAFQNAPDCLQDAVRGFLFCDVTSSAGAQNAFRIKGFIVHRDDQHEKTGPTGMDVFYELNPV